MAILDLLTGNLPASPGAGSTNCGIGTARCAGTMDGGTSPAQLGQLHQYVDPYNELFS